MSFREQVLAEIAAPPDEKLGAVHEFVLQQTTASTPEPEIPRRMSDAEFAAALKEFAEICGDVPQLSDYAYTRESIYEVHP